MPTEGSPATEDGPAAEGSPAEDRALVRAQVSARVRGVLELTRDLIGDAERHVEAAGYDSRRFGLAPRAGSDRPVNMGTYRRATRNAKGWRKLRL